jgi:hypothetical protein
MALVFSALTFRQRRTMLRGARYFVKRPIESLDAVALRTDLFFRETLPEPITVTVETIEAVATVNQVNAKPSFTVSVETVEAAATANQATLIYNAPTIGLDTVEAISSVANITAKPVFRVVAETLTSEAIANSANVSLQYRVIAESVSAISAVNSVNAKLSQRAILQTVEAIATLQTAKLLQEGEAPLPAKWYAIFGNGFTKAGVEFQERRVLVNTKTGIDAGKNGTISVDSGFTKIDAGSL